MFVISHTISKNLQPLWREDFVYEKENLYSITPNALPPVNYDTHLINSHSLTHIETPLHTNKDGKSIDWYFKNAPEHFYGEALVLKLKGNKYSKVDECSYHWVISLKELKQALGSQRPKKLLITSEFYLKLNGIHNPNYVLTLSQEAANF